MQLNLRSALRAPRKVRRSPSPGWVDAAGAKWGARLEGAAVGEPPSGEPYSALRGANGARGGGAWRGLSLRLSPPQTESAFLALLAR